MGSWAAHIPKAARLAGSLRSIMLSLLHGQRGQLRPIPVLRFCRIVLARRFENGKAARLTQRLRVAVREIDRVFRIVKRPILWADRQQSFATATAGRILCRILSFALP